MKKKTTTTTRRTASTRATKAGRRPPRALRAAVGDLLTEITLLCSDLDAGLATEIGEAGGELSENEARVLFERILIALRTEQGKKLDKRTRARIAQEVRSIIDGIMEARRTATDAAAEAGRTIRPASGKQTQHLELVKYNGLTPRPVLPEPVYFGRPIPLQEGYARTEDIKLWDGNHRLELYIDEFTDKNHRRPTSKEMLDIMLGILTLPGAGAKADPFEIEKLAQSIAVKGVERPPVIDWHGNAYDGNRRLAACNLILHSSEFDDDAKRRASHVRVWQMPDGATQDQIEAVVIALNFEDDLKMPWPEYVKAKQVYDDYVERFDRKTVRKAVTDIEDRVIRREVATKFGLKIANVTRYIRMVTWANEFREYHTEQERPETEIAHRTNRLFQYFYELDSGRGEDKLATKLQNDPAFKGLVFDLMYDDKFRNWSQVRELKKVVQLPAAVDLLRTAHASAHRETARQLVDDAVFEARKNSTTSRQAGIGEYLSKVTKWLTEDATVASMRTLDPDVLRGFYDAVRANHSTMKRALELGQSR